MKKLTRIISMLIAFVMCIAFGANVHAEGQPLPRPGLRMIGDVNGDLRIDILDILEIRNYIFDPDDFSGAYSIAYFADMNRDGKINICDIMLVRDYIFTGAMPKPPPLDDMYWQADDIITVSSASQTIKPVRFFEFGYIYEYDEDNDLWMVIHGDGFHLFHFCKEQQAPYLPRIELTENFSVNINQFHSNPVCRINDVFWTEEMDYASLSRLTPGEYFMTISLSLFGDYHSEIDKYDESYEFCYFILTVP